ncbi:MAG TPA: TetR/AcrR family transcriptional regulator [Acidimicrobiales bacterium]|nr:TetR/AcrR family transcriptional regulator [Acidimicrobiales bacterium]
MVTRTSDTRRLRSNERREQLLSVAAILFAESGYDATTMDHVALAAGVTKPLLYQHFESKHALYEEIVTAAASALLDALAVAASPDVSPREKVERGLTTYFTAVLGDDASFRLLLVESTDEDVARHLDSIERALIEFVDPLIDADLEPEHRKLLAAAVVGTAKSAAEFWFDEHGTAPDPATKTETADRLASRCAQLVWGGLRSVGRS